MASSDPSRRRRAPGRAAGVLAALAAGLLGADAAPAQAATLAVTRADDPATSSCTPSDCSLRAALATASAGDTVVLPRGDVRLDAGLGELAITRDVTVRGTGGTVRVIGAAGFRVLRVTGARVLLEDLELTRGRLGIQDDPGLPAADLEDAALGGAGLLDDGGDVTLRRVVVRDNAYRSYGSGGGAGIRSTGRLVVEDSQVLANRGDAFGGSPEGGGIQGVPGATVVRRSRIAQNLIVGNVTAMGGGVDGARVEDSVVEGNGSFASFAAGGGVSRSTVVRSLVRSNHAVAAGGGAYLSDVVSSTVTDNEVEADDPESGSGGGGVAEPGRIVNSTITANRHGQVLFGFSAGGSIAFSTVASDGPDAGPALASWSLSRPLGVTASVIAGPCRVAAGALVDGGADVVTDAGCGLGAPVVDAGLGPLGDHGGPTPTRALLPGSPALDRVPSGACPILTDQRGVRRPQDGDRDDAATCDAGAFELVPPRCTVRGTPGPDVLRGTDGPDVLCAGAGDDVLIGLGGDDELRAGSGDDVLRGGAGSDVLRGGTGDDGLLGGAGDDRLDGGPGADELRCGRGLDRATQDPADVLREGCELGWAGV